MRYAVWMATICDPAIPIINEPSAKCALLIIAQNQQDVPVL
jgi:hypothetical protein